MKYLALLPVILLCACTGANNNGQRPLMLTTPQPNTPPNGTTVMGNAVNLGWSASIGDNGTIRYMVKYSSTISGEVTIQGLPTQSYYLTGLNAGVRYTWQVSAKDNSETTGWSNPSSFVVGIAGPTLYMPRNNDVLPMDFAGMSWSAVPGTGVTGYTVEYGIGAFTTQVNCGTPQYTTDQLKAKTKYQWHVRAVGKDVTGNWSDTYYFTTH